jgi:hypothetical protein
MDLKNCCTGVGSLASHWVPVKDKLTYKIEEHNLRKILEGVSVWISLYLHYYFSMVLPTENLFQIWLVFLTKKKLISNLPNTGK